MIYIDTMSYLSRRSFQDKLVIYGLLQLSWRILQSMALFKPESSTARVFFKSEDSTARGFFKPEL